MPVTLAVRLRTQSGECARLGSPLYAELLARAAEDVEAGGVVADAFAGREQLPGRLVPGLRLMGALRAGCDPHPVDPATGEGRLTLASFVWADQVERMARLRAALRVAARVPARVERAGAADWLERALAGPPPPGTQLTVVWHSVVWQYLSQGERERAEAALATAAERARGGRGPALARLALESRRVTDRYLFELRLEGSFLPAGRLPVLALAEGHGPPVHWWPEGAAAPIPPPR